MEAHFFIKKCNNYNVLEMEQKFHFLSGSSGRYLKMPYKINWNIMMRIDDLG